MDIPASPVVMALPLEKKKEIYTNPKRTSGAIRVGESEPQALEHSL